jgi:hypothetical protein
MHVIDERVFRVMKFHVFNSESEPIGVFVHAEDAAAMVAVLGEGACITDPGCGILWSEGSEAFSAGESYDGVAEVVHKRAARES